LPKPCAPPLRRLRLTGGQVADCREADALLDTLGEGDILLADKGYDSNAIRAALGVNERVDLAGQAAAGTSHPAIVSIPFFPVAACW
jgi:IS5 family transposase